MTKVLVTGAQGQVARALADGCSRVSGHEFVFAARPEFDLAKPESLGTVLDRWKPDIIVSAAAYTAVDLAEDEPDQARKINAEAPAVIARWCATQGSRMIHLSTDYVYAGTGELPYVESDEVAPQNVYGATKLAGEQAVRETLAQHVILRTAWVYSPYGKNFVKTMLHLAASRPELRVVADQFGNPTSAADIASGVFQILEQWKKYPSLGLGQTYHLAGDGHTHWAEFADRIMQFSREAGGPGSKITPIGSADYPTKARRPANSRLDCSKFEMTWGWKPAHWSNSLAPVVAALRSGS